MSLIGVCSCCTAAGWEGIGRRGCTVQQQAEFEWIGRTFELSIYSSLCAGMAVWNGNRGDVSCDCGREDKGNCEMF